MPMLIVPRFSCAAPLLRRQPDMAALKYPHAVRTYCSSRREYKRSIFSMQLRYGSALCTVISFIGVILTNSLALAHAAAPAHPSDGVQRFTFTSPTTKQSLDVRCYIPEDPIGRQRLLFVIHGELPCLQD